MENKEFILDQTTIKKLLVMYKLRIPDFQRSFVWKKQKKYQLLQSLFRGFPIGAITLYEDKGEYYIIDGLQRINTLQQYLSTPSQIISFVEFYTKVEDDIKKFLAQNNVNISDRSIKSAIKAWYEELNELYAYEKVSPLYRKVKEKCNNIFDDVDDEMQIMEDLSEILIRKIEISHDAIALIIYQGEKDDLPDLFKNINTGSVALSQYEILQSLWMSYKLDHDYLAKEYKFYTYALDMIGGEYEIDVMKDSGEFDIFKNIVGLNFEICCMEDAIKVLEPALKKIKPITIGDNIKFYENDSIGFELYSTLLTHTSNKIIKAIEMIFACRDKVEENKINEFIRQVNSVIIGAIKVAIEYVDNSEEKENIFVSKYHSLYVIAGIIFSEYTIAPSQLQIKKIERNKSRFDLCLDFKKHKEEKWFVDENRQVGFFNSKILELLNL